MAFGRIVIYILLQLVFFMLTFIPFLVMPVFLVFYLYNGVLLPEKSVPLLQVLIAFNFEGVFGFGSAIKASDFPVINRGVVMTLFVFMLAVKRFWKEKAPEYYILAFFFFYFFVF